MSAQGSSHQNQDFSGRLGRANWLSRLSAIGRDHGFFERVGPRHTALFVEEESDTLLVTFDTAERVFTKTADGLPAGFPAVNRWEWSLLSIMGTGGTWFREAELYAYFDALIDSGFFDRYDRVVFTGRGPMCGHAAAAYSVIAPGAHVLLVNPVATLNREDAPFERRFRDAWHLDFSSRYGFAPAMVDGAAAVTLVYDPSDAMSAAHAALFRGPNVSRLRLRWGGMQIGAMLDLGGSWMKLLAAAAEGPVDVPDFARIVRPARRSFLPHIAHLMQRADGTGHQALALRAAEHGQRLASDGRFDAAVRLLRGRMPASGPSAPVGGAVSEAAGAD